MRKKYERVYCDCCGKEIDINNLNYYPSNPYEHLEFRLADEVGASNDGNRPKYEIDVVKINDICNDCMKKLCEFTKTLITVGEDDE